MEKNYFLSLFLLVFTAFSLKAQPPTFWTNISPQQIELPAGTEITRFLPEEFTVIDMDLEALENYLLQAPDEFTGEGLLLSLPMPDGSPAQMEVWFSPVYEAGISQKYPRIRTYTARRTDRSMATGRLGITYQGFHAAFHTEKGPLLITPYATGQERYYVAYYLQEVDRDALGIPRLQCGVDHQEENMNTFEKPEDQAPGQVQSRGASAPVSLRTYRLAISCVGEFGIQQGGTVDGVMSAYTTTVNVGNVVWERDAAVRMILVDETDQLIYLDPDDDPYDPGTIPNALSVNPTLFDSKIGQGAYDIGHTWTASPTGGVAGLAGLGIVCRTQGFSHKSRAASSNYANNVAAMTIEVFAHEVGHQFSANHSFNNCDGNENPSTAYEPGSGSTIMSYAGSCGNNNVKFGADDYYNIGSLEEFISYSRLGSGNTCPEIEPTGNTEPVLEIPYSDGFFIPISTPFELTAIGMDEDDDNLTYCWEQYNVGPKVPLGQPILNSPSFRSYPPTNSPTRIFPRLSTIISNSSSIREVLPTYSRDFTFKCTVRDNHPGGGGTVWKQVSFEATEASGPFLVTGPNSGTVVWEIGQSAEVTWDVANTDKNPVNCQFVDIYLSTDGGGTYPILLAKDVPNDGSEVIVVPNTPTDDARVKIKASNNIFFDISNTNFDIEINQPGYYFGPEPLFQEVCAPEAAIFDFVTAPLLGYDSLLEVSLTSALPDGAELVYSKNPFRPSDTAAVSIDLSEVTVGGEYVLEFMITAPDLDTAFRQVTLNIIATDFSELELLTPVNGTAGESQAPEFTWTEAVNAEGYYFVLASNPAFGEDDVLDEAFDLQGTSYNANAILEKGEVYFWKVRPYNKCASRELDLPYAFSTFEQSCSQKSSFDLPKVITGTGTPTVTSTINIPSGGAIADINIPNVKGRHTFVSDIDLILEAPSGEEIKLIGSFFCPTSDFNAGFDSESSQSLGCPPTGGAVVKPAQSLNAFLGQEAAGDWILKVKVTDNIGEGGSFDTWTLEICSDVSLNPPVLVNNDTLGVQEGKGVSVLSQFLRTEDADNGPDQLRYTLVTAPTNGVLLRGSDTLELGDQFTQSDINFANLAYYDTDTTLDADHFYFIVDDGQGGWVEITKFNIVVDPDAWIVGTDDLESLTGQIQLFPNPADEQVTLLMERPLPEAAQLELYSISGALLRSAELGRGLTQHRLSVADLAPGLYVLRMRSGSGVVTRRVVVK